MVSNNGNIKGKNAIIKIKLKYQNSYEKQRLAIPSKNIFFKSQSVTLKQCKKKI